jgi:AcrR family transcriptional regulator
MPGLREAKKENKRERLLNAAIELFSKKGFDQTSIGDITAHAGVAKGTFYSFFEKKGDVLLYLVDREIVTCRNHIQNTISTKKNIFDQLEQVIFTYLKYIFRNKEFSRVLAKERFDNIGTRRNKNELQLMKALAQLIDQAKKRNEIKSTVDSQCMADMIFAIYTTYVIYWLNGFIKTKRECVRRIREVIHLIFEGVGRNRKVIAN